MCVFLFEIVVYALTLAFLRDSKIGPTGLYFGEGVCGEMGVKEDPPDPFDEIQEMHENYVSLYTLYTCIIHPIL